jgi:acetyl-CoA acyltransferase 1
MPSNLNDEILNYGPAAEVLTPMGITSENVAKEFGVSRKYLVTI